MQGVVGGVGDLARDAVNVEVADLCQLAIDDQHSVMSARHCRFFFSAAFAFAVAVRFLARLHFQLKLVEGRLGLPMGKPAPMFAGQQMHLRALAAGHHFINGALANAVLARIEIDLAEGP